jgi:enamine deaminase RidA (YjgF/YER057c/UK114 family)
MIPDMKKIAFILIFPLLLGCSTGETTSDSNHVPNTWDAEKKLEELGIDLPDASSPVANYVNAVRVGNLLFLSGKGPNLPDGSYVTGKVGEDLSIEEGKEAAKLVGIAQLAVLKSELGDLNKVKRIVKVLGMVNCGPDFTQQPQVINGFSDLMVEVFGEKGKHARSAVGMNALPMNIAVEIEVIVEIEN